MRPLTRIPLTIEVAETGARTEGVIVAVLASDLDDLEEAAQRFRGAVCLAIGRIERGERGAALTGLMAARGDFFGDLGGIQTDSRGVENGT
jgi:hypothetical protein